MPMIRVPVDAAWVRRMAGLADGPWTAEAVEAAFRRYGWTGAFLPDLAWCERVDLFDAEGDTSGWAMQLYDAPPSENDPDVQEVRGMALICAEYWPPLAMEDVWATDTGYHESDDWDAMRAFAEQGAAWTIEAEARRPDFVAEFDRVHALVREIFGEPTHVLREANDTTRTVWDRGAAALTLVREPNAIDYETYDWLALEVLPRQEVDRLVKEHERSEHTRRPWPLRSNRPGRCGGDRRPLTDRRRGYGGEHSYRSRSPAGIRWAATRNGAPMRLGIAAQL